MESNLALAKCKGQIVAFTYRRLRKDDVVEGLYKYDIQSSDDGFEPASIKEHVLVNHWGSLISRDPLPVDDNGWLFLEDGDFVQLPYLFVSQQEYKNLSADIIDELLRNETQEEHHNAHHQVHL